MPLHLRIENETSLPDGGPISYSVQASRGGINIGRDQYLDWVLPDPTRFISGTHCEVRYRDGQYWLHDVSTNGTFVNGSEYRLAGPHRLRSGDRIEIGRYVVAVEIVGEPNTEPARDSAAFGRQAPPDGPLEWNLPEQDAPIPGDPREFEHRRSARGIDAPSFLDWMADLPSVAPPPASRPAAPPAPSLPRADDQWLQPPVAWDAPAQPRRESPPASWDIDPVPPQSPRPPPPQSPLAWDAPPDEQLPPAAPPHQYPAAGGQGAANSYGAPASSQFQPQGESWDRPAANADLVKSAYTPAPAPDRQPALPQAFDFRKEAIDQEFIARFARGARLPRDAIRDMDPGDFAEMLGEIVMLTIENLRQLQLARAQFKGKIRSANHTLLGPLDNNPLRFSPSADAAMRIMFGPRQEGYLDSVRAVEAAFGDIKSHQMDTVAAMQSAVRQALGSVSPKAVDAAAPPDKGVGNLLGTRKARLWEKYCDLWKSNFGDNEEDALVAFMRLFSEAYDGRR